jgi:hypothetical protein
VKQSISVAAKIGSVKIRIYERVSIETKQQVSVLHKKIMK